MEADEEVEVTSGRSRAHALGALGDSEASLQNEVLPAQVRGRRSPNPPTSYSVRKSLISTLYGIYSAEGIIDVNETLDRLGLHSLTPEGGLGIVAVIAMSRKLYLKPSGTPAARRRGPWE